MTKPSFMLLASWFPVSTLLVDGIVFRTKNLVDIVFYCLPHKEDG